MKRTIVLGLLLSAAQTVMPAQIQAQSSTMQVEWHTTPLVKITVTPNYSTPYGAMLSKFGGTPPPIQAGPGAPASVDFGSVLAGDTYLYRYAAHVQVSTTDPSGFYLYGEGTATFVTTTAGAAPLNTQLFYVNSVASGDTNTGYNAPSYPFAQTAASVVGGSPPSISYSTYPNPISTAATPSADYYYDYLLKVPPTAVPSAYSVWIVYTVVPR